MDFCVRIHGRIKKQGGGKKAVSIFVVQNTVIAVRQTADGEGADAGPVSF